MRSGGPALGAALALLLGCGPGGPEPELGCRLLSEQWQGAGPFEVVGCRERGRRGGEEGGAPSVTLELELELRVLEATQIFAARSLEHRSGPRGEGSLRPAGEVLAIRDELRLVETEDGWQPAP